MNREQDFLRELRELLAPLDQGTPKVVDALNAIGERLITMGRAQRPEEKAITTMPLIKRLKDQRDALADAIRLVVQADDMEAHNEAIFKGKWKKGSKAWGGSLIEQTRKEGMEKARAALEGVPTSEQQLRNIAEGIGMTYEELTAHLSPQKGPA